jgi:hypothetical protein
MVWFKTLPKVGLTLLFMAKVQTEYMASSNVGETQQRTNATIAPKKQILAFDNIVGRPSAVLFG